MDIYKYVDVSPLKPTDTTYLATWTRNDCTAKAPIMSFPSGDFIYLASNAPTAKDAGKAVEDNRDSRNSSILHHIVQSFISTKMQHIDVLTDHIASHEPKYTYTAERCWSANDPSAPRHLLVYLKCDETNARHLLISLPAYMNHIIDNLQ